MAVVKGCSVISGWIRNMMLYRKDEDFPIGVKVDMGAMTDINHTKYAWCVFYENIDEAVNALKRAYPALNEGDFHVFEAPTCYIVNVTRKGDWYDFAIFKVLKGQMTVPDVTVTLNPGQTATAFAVHDNIGGKSYSGTCWKDGDGYKWEWFDAPPADKEDAFKAIIDKWTNR